MPPFKLKLLQLMDGLLSIQRACQSMFALKPPAFSRLRFGAGLRWFHEFRKTGLSF
jgi:hypothetical protein